jgi:predicted oxidoreductase
MNKIALHNTGPFVSRMIGGMWRLADAYGDAGFSTEKLIETYLECGVTSFDNADIYGGYTCEGYFGKAVKALGIEREMIEVVTKCGIKLVHEHRPTHRIKSYDTSRQHIISSAERSLRAMQMDYIDLLLIHRPDPLMVPQEVAKAFDALKSSGKVKHFGVSNFSNVQFDLLQAFLDFPLVTNQIELSPFCLSPITNGALDHCMLSGIKPMAWSPFGGGRLFQQDLPLVQRLQKLLREEPFEGLSLDQLVLAWLMKHPAGVLPVLGTTKAARVQRATQAVDIEISQEDWFRVYAAVSGHDVP